MESRPIAIKTRQQPPAKAIKPRDKNRLTPRFQVPFTRRNYLVLAAGIVLLVIGYACLAQGPHDGFLSLTLAPTLLVLGYCVVIPYGIMTREKQVAAETGSGGD